MNTIVFDGKSYAKRLEALVKIEVEKLSRPPHLVWVSVGESEANALYGKLKGKAAERVGISFQSLILNSSLFGDEIAQKVKAITTDPLTDAVLVQLPILSSIKLALAEQRNIVDCIDASKDVDCLTSVNLGRLLHNDRLLMPATVASVLRILEAAWFQLKSENFTQSLFPDEVHVRKLVSSKRVLVIGGGVEIGKPISIALSDLGASILWCRSKEKQLRDLSLMADIVISATGVSGMLKRDMVKEEAILIDVGAPTGDCNYEEFLGHVSFITPVPGGVGPVTVASLMANCLLIALGK